jgi:hypothetical protein
LQIFSNITALKRMKFTADQTGQDSVPLQI